MDYINPCKIDRIDRPHGIICRYKYHVFVCSIISPIGSGGSPSSASETSPSDSESESSSAESTPAPAPAPLPPAAPSPAPALPLPHAAPSPALAPVPAPAPAQRPSWSLCNFAPPAPAAPDLPDLPYHGKELEHALADVKGKPVSTHVYYYYVSLLIIPGYF